MSEVTTMQEWERKKAENRSMPQEEFCQRFIARMVARAPFERFEPDNDEAEGQRVADYAAMSAFSYWEDPDQREEGPEECADADMSYWGE